MKINYKKVNLILTYIISTIAIFLSAIQYKISADPLKLVIILVFLGTIAVQTYYYKKNI